MKNKVGVPFKNTEMDLMFGKGFCAIRDIVSFAVEKKIISKEGPYYSYNGTKSHGMERLIITLSQNQEFLDTLKDKVISYENTRD